LRNDGGTKKNWIKVRVKCTKSNRTGFGTKVEIEADGQTQAQEIGGQTSYLSQNFQEAHFGLNHEKEIIHLKVTFASGMVREMEHVAANKIVTVHYPCGHTFCILARHNYSSECRQKTVATIASSFRKLSKLQRLAGKRFTIKHLKITEFHRFQ